MDRCGRSPPATSRTCGINGDMARKSGRGSVATDPEANSAARRAAEGSASPPPVAERRIARLHSHGRALVLPALVFLAAAGAAGYWVGSFPDLWLNMLVLGLLILLVILLSVLPLLFWMSRQYTITTRRVVLRSGVLVRIRQELLHSRAVDVTLKRSPIQMLFRSGDVLIGAGSDSPLVLRDVPRAGRVLEALQDLGDANRSLLTGRVRVPGAGSENR
jgi:membrane protein YdbS with pleckstrin-like domain